ncbi:HlyD family secretion protein [Mesonia sp. HuA40]|uniref:HlyD family secretion protein n=1 Tax=Mesonia sp. HuA40 TaxID=2602761 RepID=UPI0011CC410F|nr:HlyD family efflux transporter periplasmic adaptor subunit [Mesonia sp. HuA40]TXK73900.1 HlyD family efflux transporter periplasmic adaptor subunit [Mesonia sp. HuA40]
MNFSSDPINNLENLTAKNKTTTVSIYIIVVLAIVVALGLLPIVEVNVSSQGRGIVRSLTDPVPIMAITQGKVAGVFIKNNQDVKKGDTLLTIATEHVSAELKLQDTLQTTIKEQIADLQKLTQGNFTNLKTVFYKGELQKYRTGLFELQSKVAQAQVNHDRNKLLFDRDVIAKAEYENYLYNLQFAKESKQNYMATFNSQWQNTKQQLLERINNIQATSEQLEIEKNNYVITSPISGTIENFIGLLPGSFINPSQSLGVISPNQNLIVECIVAPKDIGLINRSQKVQFQFDAFNYNQWGLIEGNVIEIDQNATVKNEDVYFKVRCSLNTFELQLNSGYRTEIRKGLTVTGRFVITRRSLFDLLFDKVDDWLNPTQISN